MFDELTRDLANLAHRKTSDVYKHWTCQGEDWNSRRRYSRTLSRTQWGIWYHPNNLKLHLLTLTSTPDNNYLNELKNDFRKFVRIMRKKNNGKFEYLAVPELTPRRGLFHLHAIFKSELWFDTVSITSLWTKIHNASQTECQPIGNTETDVERVGRYCAKHLTKRYSDPRLKCRPMYSKHFLPPDCIVYFRYLNKLTISQGKEDWKENSQQKKEYCLKMSQPQINNNEE